MKVGLKLFTGWADKKGKLCRCVLLRERPGLLKWSVLILAVANNHCPHRYGTNELKVMKLSSTKGKHSTLHSLSFQVTNESTELTH